MKQARYGDAQFLHQLSVEQQVQVIGMHRDAQVEVKAGDRVETTEWEPHVPFGARGCVEHVYDRPECEGIDVLLDDGRRLNILPGAVALIAPDDQDPRPSTREDRTMDEPQEGQVYRSADPRGGPLIRIVQVHPGNRVEVVDALDGKHRRPLLKSALHAEPVTKVGRPRRTGYVLEPPR